MDIYNDIEGAAPPPCVNAISTSCPQLQEEATGCIPDDLNKTYVAPQSCFCPKLVNTSCPDICQQGRDTADYLNWALKLCGNYTTYGDKNASFTQAWKDFAQLEHTAYLNLMPWSWKIQYNPEDDYRPPPALGQPPLRLPKCPSETGKFLSFVSINISVFAISLILGRRTVVHKLTFGKMGKPEGSGMWVLTSLFFLGLSIAANFINAYLIRSAPGFGSVSLGDLVLLWCSRPRLAWSAALLVFVGKERGVYFTTGASALISEIVLQSLGAVYLGRTVDFAALHSFYRVGRGDTVVMGWAYALMMYVGALLWILAVGWALFQIVYSFLGLRELVYRVLDKADKRSSEATRRQRDRIATAGRQRAAKHVLSWIAVSRNVLMDRSHFLYRLRQGVREEHQVAVRERPHSRNATQTSRTFGYDWRKALEAMGLSEESLKRMRTVVFLMIPPFIGQWLFWAGFIRLAGDR